MEIKPASSMQGELTVPGDKSISHRAVMLGAIAEGKTHVTGFLPGADCLSTIDSFRKLGIEIEHEGTTVTVKGKGLDGLRAPTSVLNVGNSGTTMRLLSGILSGQSFQAVLDGDASIRKRPMKRIITPLSAMGAEIFGHDGTECAPLSITGSRLHGISYASPVASAQVKSCILLAGLYADGETTVTEPALSRDHTERMLSACGAVLKVDGLSVTVQPRPRLIAQNVVVPGDISSAAYFIAAALLVPGSEVRIKNVGINPTRDGILKVAAAMGAEIEYQNRREASGEPVADLLVRTAPLHGTRIAGDLIPTLIDELPVIAVMAACAEGETEIRDAAELKVKETDRIATVVQNLQAVGIEAEPLADGMVIRGGRIRGGEIEAFGDHRIAMAFAVAGLASKEGVKIKGAEAVSVSYPSFFADLAGL
ncbi:MAG: 3-phosphoshikimate 1-carboxyvinyltransferase [Lachnospiraceae bacterium]|nr:3-phosphoshikimate 1-carboxyvinyltransferase [Lachnospiraceae bacterium]